MTDKSAKKGSDKGQKEQKEKPAVTGEQRVRVDDSRVKSSYSNVCNATSTRDEVVLNFGLNESWDRGHQELHIQLHHRVIMSPHAAKRLHEMLGSLIDEHEKRYGPIGGANGT